jgi:hypothetical protein
VWQSALDSFRINNRTHNRGYAMKRLFLLLLVLAVGLLGLSSCNNGESNKGLMEGTWSLDSTETTAGKRVLGDGNFDISYVGEVSVPPAVMEIYSGTGTIGGVDYDVAAGYDRDSQVAVVVLAEPGEDPDNSIGLLDYSYTGGKTIDGDYMGDGDYATGQPKDIGEGTFTATQN